MSVKKSRVREPPAHGTYSRDEPTLNNLSHYDQRGSLIMITIKQSTSTAEKIGVSTLMQLRTCVRKSPKIVCICRKYGLESK